MHPENLRKAIEIMAEEEGFEPPKDLRPCLISSQVVSTTHPLLLKLRGLLQKIGAENSSRKSGMRSLQGASKSG